MKVIDLEIGKAEFSEDGCYKVTVNEKFHTNVSSMGREPGFHIKKFQILSSNFKEMKEVVSVIVYRVKGEVETVIGAEKFELAFGKDTTTSIVEFSKLRGALLDGVIHLSYKMYKQSLADSLRNSSGICCLSINANYLNIAVEKPYDLKVLVKDYMGNVLATTKLNNKSSTFYLDTVYNSIDRNPVEFVISDSPKLYSIVTHPGRTLATSIQLMNGDPIILTTQLVDGCDVVTGMVHSSALREASVSTTATGKRFSLSPRRPSVLSGVEALQSLGEISAKKSLLYIEDCHLAADSPSSPVSMAEGIQWATAITAAESVSPLNAERLSVGAVGPIHGAFIACSSKNEILLDETAASGSKKKNSKKNKRQLHVINLGLIPVHLSSLSSPLKLRAELFDRLPEQQMPSANLSSVDKSDVAKGKIGADDQEDPEKTTPPPDTPKSANTDVSPSKAIVSANEASNTQLSVFFSGSLDETSRELFNESGCIAVVLEGKLFRKGVSTLSAGVSTIASEGSVSPMCMAVKVYLSLIPSSSSLQKQQSGSTSTSKSSTVSPRATQLESVSEKDIFAIDHEILDFGGYSVNRNVVVSEKDAFNVITPQTAQPNELSGSSVLSIPVTAQNVEISTNKTGEVTSYGELPRGQLDSFGEQLDPKHILHLQQLQLEDQQRSRMIASNNAFAEIVRAELIEKQRLVEQLMKDVNIRNEAIQVVGKDIRQLRQEKLELMSKLESLEATLEQKNSVERALNANTERMLKTSTALQEMDRDTLVRLLNQLRDALNTSEAEKVELQTVLRGAKSTIDQFVVMKRDYKELQTAHMEQTRHLQKMQSKINKVDVYRSTIATQEGVIAAMQNAIEAKIQKHRGIDKSLFVPRPPKKNSVVDSRQNSAYERDDLISRAEYDAMLNQLRETSETVSELQERNRILEEQLELAKYADSDEEEEDVEKATSVSGDDGEDEMEGQVVTSDILEARRKIDQLEAELVSKGFRISALEKQLETSTVDYSREIARLRTKLFELEINSSLMDEGEGGKEAWELELDRDVTSPDMTTDGIQAKDKNLASPGDPIMTSATGVNVSVDNAKDSDNRIGTLSMNSDNTSSELPVLVAGESIPQIDEITSKESTPAVEQLSDQGETLTDQQSQLLLRPAEDRIVEATVDILDASDSGGNRSTKCADLTLLIRYVYDPNSKTSRFSFNKMEIHGFQQAENKTRFQPYLEMHLPHMNWTLKTDTVTDAGPKVTWSYDGDTQCLVVTDDELKRGDEIQCFVKKVSVKAHADFLIGVGTLSLKL